MNDLANQIPKPTSEILVGLRLKTIAHEDGWLETTSEKEAFFEPTPANRWQDWKALAQDVGLMYLGAERAKKVATENASYWEKEFKNSADTANAFSKRLESEIDQASHVTAALQSWWLRWLLPAAVKRWAAL